MGGRPLKPTALKVLKGTARADRLNPDEPQPKAVKLPAPPSVELKESAMREWERITRELISVNVLTVIDYSMLEMYCYYYGEWVEASKIVNSEGAIQRDGRLHGAVRVAKEAYEAAHKIGMQFGITPSSRARINAPKKAEKDDFDNL